jgi:hypothetical protein
MTAAARSYFDTVLPYSAPALPEAGSLLH